MPVNSKPILLIICCLALSILSPGQEMNNYDTAEIAIIQAHRDQRKIQLTTDDLRMIDSLVVNAVKNYNSLLGKITGRQAIDLIKTKYKKQLVVSWDNNGEVELLVNCFCRVNDDRWKTQLYFVKDGGNCYFRLQINLTTKTYFNFIVNGSA